MGQKPWEILKTKNVTIEYAHNFLGKSLKAGQEVLQSFDAAKECMSTLRTHLGLALNDRRALKVMEAKESVDGRATQTLFKKIKIFGNACLQPLHLANPEKGIRSFLYSNTNVFIPELAGIWCGFRKLTVLDSVGYSYHAEEFGLVNLQVELEVLVFCPQAQMQLVGEITEILPDGVNCTVLGTFSGTIPPVCLLPGQIIKLTENDEYIITSPDQGGSPMVVGSRVKFVVISLTCHIVYPQEVYSIVGSLRPVQLR